MEPLEPIIIPESHNYAAAFLMLACNYRCSYCINLYEKGNFARKFMKGEDWVRALNRIVSRDDLPITLQGGEPSLHRDFITIINNVKPELHLDILTNLQFDVAEFIAKVDPARLRRNAPYASIRVSYHPEVMDLDATIAKVLAMQDAGFSIGLFGVMAPSQAEVILAAQQRCNSLGIDFRTKEFLGEQSGEMHGTYLYPGSCDLVAIDHPVMCKTTELIMGPGGDVFRCHSDLYEGRPPVGHILDPDFRIEEIYRPCEFYGFCNPCDVKVKTNRFQIFGHTSVSITTMDGEDMAVRPTATITREETPG